MTANTVHVVEEVKKTKKEGEAGKTTGTKRCRDEGLPAWVCLQCQSNNAPYYNFCGMCGTKKVVKVTGLAPVEDAQKKSTKKMKTGKNMQKTQATPKKLENREISSSTASVGRGISFHLPTEIPSITEEKLSIYQLQLMGLDWEIKKTRSGATRKVASWSYAPRGTVDPKNVVPPDLYPVKPLIAALLAQAERCSGGEAIIPIQVYICLYDEGTNTCPEHSHSCRQLTMSLGSTRTLTVNGKRVRMKHGNAIVLHGQRHAVIKEKNVMGGRMSINLFFTTTAEVNSASVNSIRKTNKSSHFKSSHEEASKDPKPSSDMNGNRAGGAVFEGRRGEQGTKKSSPKDTLATEKSLSSPLHSASYLHKSCQMLCEASKGISAGQASILDYETIKDKASPKQTHYGFGPKAHSQWHWFFVARKTLTADKPDDDIEKGRTYKFKLELDKWQLAQGKATPLEEYALPKPEIKYQGGYKFSYGCTGAKMEKTVRKKKEKSH
mmetsp:Transcript_17948/g.29226  ORF Transcript_17948/g.29226 Transcript_17948/m.29226 type:complete len:493 (+) Transcript_17948:66-1544(+)